MDRGIFLKQFGDDKQADPNRKEFTNNMIRDFNQIQKIPKKSIWKNLFDRWCSKKSKYHRLLRKSRIQIDKELDLQKFIHRSRVQVTSMLGLLTAPQSVFVDKISQIVVRESTDFNKTSTDDELASKLKDLDLFAKKMVVSKDKTD